MFGTVFKQSQHWSEEKWKSTMAKGGEKRKYFNIVLIHQDKEILDLRALQGHSGRNLIDPPFLTFFFSRTTSSSTFFS